MEHRYRADEERGGRLTPASPGIATVTADSPPRVPGQSDVWVHVWFHTAPDTWSVLAIVPAAPGFDATNVGTELTESGRAYGIADVTLINATGVHAEGIRGVVAACERRTAAGLKTIVVLDSAFTNPSAIAIARNANAVLLAVPLGATRIAHARRTVEVIGRERFIGAVAIGADGRPHPEG